jgi:hypothetical protein
MKTEVNWIRFVNTNRLKNIGGESPNILNRRVYGVDGKLWPRLVIVIWDNILENGGLKISASKKRNKTAWWNSVGIPTSLLPDVVEMLDEVIKNKKL